MHFDSFNAQKLQSIGFFLLLGVLIQSCSTLHKTAEEMMNNESYEEAIRTYELILRKTPNDADAVAGLKSAKEKFLDKRLIEIRLARIGNNPEQAWDLLLDVVKREHSWSFYPTGKVAFTQEEETRIAIEDLKRFVEVAVRQKLPLKSEHAVRKYAPIFEKSFSSQFSVIDRISATAGREKCEGFKKEVSRKTPYYSQFILRFCEYYSADSRIQRSGLNHLDFNDFVGPVEYQTKLVRNRSEMPKAWDQFLENALREALLQTAWHHGKGKTKLIVKADGTLGEEILRQKVNMIHEYTVQIPFEKVEPVKVRRVQTLKGSHQVKDPYTGVVATIPVNDVKEYDEVVQSKRTEFRTEVRTFGYEATKVIQRLNAEALAQTTLLNETLIVPLATSTENESITHDQNLPMVRLDARPLRLPSADLWFQDQLGKYKTAWFEALKQLWIRKHCEEGDPKRSTQEQGNQALKCARQKNISYPSYVENWFEESLGVSVVEFSDLFSSID